MYKFGHTSPISLPPIPSQDAIPLNTVSHGVVGIMRPVTKKQNKTKLLGTYYDECVENSIGRELCITSAESQWAVVSNILWIFP